MAVTELQSQVNTLQERLDTQQALSATPALFDMNKLFMQFTAIAKSNGYNNSGASNDTSNSTANGTSDGTTNSQTYKNPCHTTWKQWKFNCYSCGVNLTHNTRNHRNRHNKKMAMMTILTPHSRTSKAVMQGKTTSGSNGTILLLHKHMKVKMDPFWANESVGGSM